MRHFSEFIGSLLNCAVPRSLTWAVALGFVVFFYAPELRAGEADDAVSLLDVALKCPTDTKEVNSTTDDLKGEKWIRKTVRSYLGTSDEFSVLFDQYVVDETGIAELPYQQIRTTSTAKYSELDHLIVRDNRIELTCLNGRNCFLRDMMWLEAKSCWKSLTCGEVTPEIMRPNALREMKSSVTIELCDNAARNDAFVALEYLIENSR